MDFSWPHSTLGLSPDLEVLIVLSRITGDLTGRQVSRLVGSSSQPTVQSALHRLADQGIVHQRAAGKAFLYSLNREHLAAPAVEILRDIRMDLRRRIKAHALEWTIPPASIVLFGSVARGDASINSDIDLLIVTPEGVSEDPVWRRQIETLTERIQNWTGNWASIIEVDESQLSLLKNRPIIDEIRSDGITVYGSDFAELLPKGSHDTT